MKDNNIFFNYAAVAEAEERAKKIGVNFDEILQRFSLSRKQLAAARGAYGRSAVSNGYDGSANLGIMAKDRYEMFCTAFMLTPETYLVQTPPKIEQNTSEKPVVKPEPTLQNEDLLLTLEALTGAVTANTAHMNNLKEEIHQMRMTTKVDTGADRAAQAAEDVAMKMITANRALDAIDNKLNTAVSSIQRLEAKIEKNTNAALDSANKLKAVVEGMGGLLTKVTRICALYERPRAK